MLFDELIVQAQQQFHHDQNHDIPLHPQAASGLQQIEYNFGGTADHFKLAFEGSLPLVQFILIFQPDIEHFQIGFLPENFRL